MDHFVHLEPTTYSPADAERYSEDDQEANDSNTGG
jgi:hypothetical protein